MQKPDSYNLLLSEAIIALFHYVKINQPGAVRDFLKMNSLWLKLKENNLDLHFFDVEEIPNRDEIFSIEEIEKKFEMSLEPESARKLGATYTPAHIVDRILDEVLENRNCPSRENPLIDPACGIGVFLVRAALKIARISECSFAEASELVCGIDIDPKAISTAKLILDTVSLVECGEISRVRLLCADSLLEPKEIILTNLAVENGFHSVVGNPPYVKLQNLPNDYAKKLVAAYPEVASGSFSLASLFLYVAPNLLIQNGKAGFITLNNIFTSLSGEKLREIWSQKRNVYKIVDFRHFMIFDAGAYTCLIYMTKEANSNLDFIAVTDHPLKRDFIKDQPNKINLDELNPKKWRLGSSFNLNAIKQLENVGVKLREIADIKVGIATLFDKAYIGKFHEGQATFLGGDGITRIIPSSKILNFVKVSELKNRNIETKDYRPVIFPYTRDSSACLIALEQFTSDSRQLAEHLQSWRMNLEARNIKDRENWHQWGRRQSLFSPGPKLLTKTFDSHPNFRLENSNALFSNGYSIKPKELIDSYDILHLQMFLESKLVHLYALVTSFEISGGYQCYQKNFIENICLPSSHELSKFVQLSSKNSEVFLNLLLEYYKIKSTHFEKNYNNLLGS